MIVKKEIDVVGKELITDYIECDVCHKKFYKNKNNADGSIDIENAIHEFITNNMIHIQKSFGYGSRIGDGELLHLDICEDCMIATFGLPFILNHCEEA